MSMRTQSIALAAALSLLAGHVWAGPFQDFEKELRTTYAVYRVALFETNQKNKAATEAALNKFKADWQALSVRWTTTKPPHYADDPAFGQTIQRVDATISHALSQTMSGQISDAHETLEKIRDELANLRRRNGIIVYSDRMNAYHTQMEHVLTHGYDGFSASGLLTLREDAAILAFLYADMSQNPPADAANADDFATLDRSVKNSVEALLAAARQGDAAAAKQAISGLKKPYSQLFLKFG